MRWRSSRQVDVTVEIGKTAEGISIEVATTATATEHRKKGLQALKDEAAVYGKRIVGNEKEGYLRVRENRVVTGEPVINAKGEVTNFPEPPTVTTEAAPVAAPVEPQSLSPA